MNRYLKVLISIFLLFTFSAYANENDSLQNLRDFHLKHAKRDLLISGVGFIIGASLFTLYYSPDIRIRESDKIGFSVAIALPSAFAFNSLIDLIQAMLIKEKIHKLEL